MRPPPPWHDDYTLLCERCGYVLEGLADEGGACPECGKPVAESLPGARPGSASQNSPGWPGFLRTLTDMHARPRRVFHQMRIDPQTDRGLTMQATAFSAFFSAAILTAGWMVATLPPGGPQLSWPSDVASAVPGLALQWLFTAVVIWCVLTVLTAIERQGVVYFARRRGWRVTRRVASAICAHAACTWWVAGAGVGIGLLAASRVEAALMPVTAGTVFDGIITWAGPILGFTLGMLPFETLVWMGVRECRFINPARPGP